MVPEFPKKAQDWPVRVPRAALIVLRYISWVGTLSLTSAVDPVTSATSPPCNAECHTLVIVHKVMMRVPITDFIVKSNCRRFWVPLDPKILEKGIWAKVGLFQTLSHGDKISQLFSPLTSLAHSRMFVEFWTRLTRQFSHCFGSVFLVFRKTCLWTENCDRGGDRCNQRRS